MIVIDSSITLPWYFVDEISAHSETVFERVATDGAVVPGLWRFEVANGFRMAIRRKRIDSTYRNESIADLQQLPIRIDAESLDRIWTDTIELSDLYGLTIYNAAYLELAVRLGLPLATLDDELRAAAVKAGVASV